MTFGELLDATNPARRDAPVRVRLGDGRELDIALVELAQVDLDEGKRLGEDAEGLSREGMTVWLVTR